MIRTNAVIMSKNDGNRVREVIKPNNCNVRLYCVPFAVPLTLTKGMPCAAVRVGNAMMAMARMMLAKRWVYATFDASVFLILVLPGFALEG